MAVIAAGPSSSWTVAVLPAARDRTSPSVSFAVAPAGRIGAQFVVEEVVDLLQGRGVLRRELPVNVGSLVPLGNVV